MLELTGVVAGYGKLTVLRGVDLRVQPGTALGIFGRNGAGKSTLAMAILGQVQVTGGEVAWNGLPLRGKRAHDIVRAGISLVPQDRGLFVRQSIEENLLIAAYCLRINRADRRHRLEEAYARFPSLAARRSALASSLSGGEAQMLALAKALLRQPRLLILDEPSIGLAPTVLERLAATLRELKTQGVGVLVTEQNISWLLNVLDSACILDQGRIAQTIPNDDLHTLDAGSILAAYLGEGFNETARTG